jgi:hypothetical protein
MSITLSISSASDCISSCSLMPAGCRPRAPYSGGSVHHKRNGCGDPQFHTS